MLANCKPFPSDFDVLERQGCAALLPGPRGWTSPACLRDLTSLAFPLQLPNIRASHLASKCCVLRIEDGGGLAVSRRAERLRSILTAVEEGSPARLHWLPAWLPSLASRVLLSADHQMWHRLRAPPPSPPMAETRAGWQRRA